MARILLRSANTEIPFEARTERFGAMDGCVAWTLGFTTIGWVGTNDAELSANIADFSYLFGQLGD